MVIVNMGCHVKTDIHPVTAKTAAFMFAGVLIDLCDVLSRGRRSIS